MIAPNGNTVRRRNQHHADKRAQLLSAASKSRKKKKNGSADSADATKATAIQEAKEITSSLRRTKAMMQQELSRMSNVSESIDHDGKMLKKTKDEHLGLKGGIQGAKGSFMRLKLKEKEDEIVFWASVVFFYLVVLYVLWTRIRIPFLMW